MVTVADARAVAARWIAEHAASIPGFAGAFVSGSAAWLPGDAELPPASDVDVMVVTADDDPPPKLGKFRWEGVLVEVTYLSWAQLPSAEAVLTSYHLAAALRNDTVIADPTGRLARLHAATAAEFAGRSWVRRRCRNAEQRIVDGLGALDRTSSPHDRVTAWLFPTGITTHVLLTAGLRNPTVRKRYAAARGLLGEYGLSGAYEELLCLLGCADMTPARAGHHLRAMTEVFDATALRSRTPFVFASDITAAARPIAVDGSRALIAQGLHREAVFWIVATYARCLKILAADAPDAYADFTPGFEELLADLGIATDLTRRAQDVLDHLPRLRRLTETIIAANPSIHD
jgi:hypothetical protein